MRNPTATTTPAFSPSLAAWLGDAAADALLAEAALPHKPGLVGPGRSGAHDDMDHPLMVASAEALRPWFSNFAAIALASDEADPGRILAALRPAGIRAEEDMFRVTGGVNTHKGAIFALGLLAACSALLTARLAAAHPAAIHPEESLEPGDAIRALAARMAGGIIAAELSAERKLQETPSRESAGERLFRQLGARGARGQAEAGYPIVGTCVLPVLRRARACSVSGDAAGREAALVEALLGSMAELEDTCILSRGGPAGLKFVRAGARTVLELGALGTAEGRLALERFDAGLTARRLSPGGSADMLAAGIFLDSVENTLILQRV